MTDLREKIARVIYGEHGGYPFEDPCAPSGLAFTKADQIIALLPQPAVPEGWVETVEAVTRELTWARDVGDLYQRGQARTPMAMGRELKRRMDDCIALLAASPSPPAETWDDAAVERAAEAFYTANTAPHGQWRANDHKPLWIASMRAALAALPTPPKESDR